MRGRRATDLPLVGRDPELAALRRVTADLTEGRGGRAAIVGPPGVGKTRMLREVVAAAGDGCVVVPVAFEKVEADPLAPFRRGLSHAISDRECRSDGSRLTDSVDALIDTVERIAVRQPLLLALDDVQWADERVYPAIAGMARLGADRAVAVVAASRPFGPGSRLASLFDLLAGDGSCFVELRALGVGDARRLAEAAAGATLSPTLAHDVDAAGGNPLFVLEVVRTLRAEGRLTVNGGTAVSAGGPMPTRLRATVLRHVRSMAGDTVMLLQAGSIFDGPFSVTDVMAVSGAPPGGLVVSVERAIEAGLLEESGDHLVFRHELIRDAVYDDVPRSVRAAMHGRAIERLRATGAPITTIARHLVRAATASDRSTVAGLLEMAEAATAVDVSVAIELLERASELAGPFPDLAERIDDRLIGLLSWAERGEEAVALARTRLAATVDSRRERRLRPALAEALAVIGREPEAAQEAAIALTVPDLPVDERARLHVLLSIGSYVSDPADALTKAAEGERLAREAGRPAIVAGALAMQAWAAHGLGRWQDAVGFAEQATVAARRAMGDGGGDPSGAYLVWTLSVLGFNLCARGDVDAALRACAEARATAARLRLPEPIEIFGYAVRCHVARCAWDDALAEIDARRTRLTDLGLPDTGVVTSGPVRDAALRAPIAVLRGRIGEALPLLNVWAGAARGATDYPTALLWRAAADALARPAYAAATFDDAWRAGDEIRDRVAVPLPRHFPLASRLVRLAVASGRTELAERATTEAEATAKLADTPALRATALACRAVVDRCADTARAAVSEVRLLPVAGLSAWDMVEAAQVLAASSTSEADAVLREVEALEASFGVATGANRRRRTGAAGKRAAATKFGWESLTATELTIVGLVARGLSNPAVAEELSISRHTVEAHLKHVYAKLGLHSRAALAAEATRRQAAG